MAKLTRRDIVKVLKNTVDPEIGMNIVDLGLLQGIEIDENNNVKVKMTMTSPMCPVTSIILADAQLRIESIPGVGKVEIELSWDPMWSPEMISEEARAAMQV
ncbi:MAG: iron-sulfur cluster assembly protein [Candidatus Micrarchaeaceae archaeon]